MFIVKYKNWFIGVTILLIVASLGAVWQKGLNSGIDFTGGSVLEGEYAGVRPDTDSLTSKVEAVGISPTIIQTTGDRGVIVRTRNLSEADREKLISVLGGTASTTNATTTGAAFVQKTFNSVGPSISADLRNRSLWAIVTVIFLIVLYITFAFRKVSRPVASWKYGLIAVLTLVHDVVVPTGFAAARGVQVDVLFVTAILAILGFSIHDTIVVFDRIRENLRGAGKKETFGETVGKSLEQTFTRSINTSLTVVLVLLVLFFKGGGSTHDFALTLIVGIIAGTYSSIFFASPLLVQFFNWQEKGGKK